MISLYHRDQRGAYWRVFRSKRCSGGHCAPLISIFRCRCPETAPSFSVSIAPEYYSCITGLMRGSSRFRRPRREVGSMARSAWPAEISSEQRKRNQHLSRETIVPQPYEIPRCSAHYMSRHLHHLYTIYRRLTIRVPRGSDTMLLSYQHHKSMIIGWLPRQRAPPASRPLRQRINWRFDPAMRAARLCLLSRRRNARRLTCASVSHRRASIDSAATHCACRRHSSADACVSCSLRRSIGPPARLPYQRYSASAQSSTPCVNSSWRRLHAISLWRRQSTFAIAAVKRRFLK